MTQLSVCQIFPNSADVAELPDFDAVLSFQNYDLADFSMQFNLLSEKAWYQFVAEVLPGGTSPNVAGDEAIGCPTCLPVSGASVNGNYANPGYVVQPSPRGFTEQTDTGVPYMSLLDGALSLSFSLHSGLFALSLGSYVRNYAKLSYPPSCMTLEVTGASTGRHVDFTRMQSKCVFDFASEVRLAMAGPSPPAPWPGYQFDWGKYNGEPLAWANETGETANDWTNILSQAPTSVALEYSVNRGNQSPNNPPYPSPTVPNLFNVSPPASDRLGSYSGISSSWSNPSLSDVQGVVFVILKNALNQTVAVLTGSATFTANSTTSAFAPLTTPLTGTYKATAFVISLANRPISASAAASVTF